MTGILDRVARAFNEFQPETCREYIALQLARRSQDISNVRPFMAALDRYPVDMVVRAWQRTSNLRPEQRLPALNQFLSIDH